MLKFVQDNLERSKLATHELSLYCDKERVDVACVQEPYTNKCTMTGMRADDRILIQADPNPMVAVIIFNKKKDVIVD